MNRQRIFEHFVKTCGRLGRCTIPNTSANGVKAYCEYAKEGHPGCAMGCQPEFHQACTTFGVEPRKINGPIYDLCMRDNDTDLLPELVKAVYDAFGAQSLEDKQFLRKLQVLHDEEHHWDGLVLSQFKVDDFARDNNLQTVLV